MLKKRSKKKVVAFLLFCAFLIALFPDISSQTVDGKPQPDYGIFGEIEDLQDEKNSRINSPEIVSDTEERLDNITIETSEEKVDLTARREVIQYSAPVPSDHEIFEAMKYWEAYNNTDMLDWLLPPPLGSGGPLNYYIYSNYVNSTNAIPNWVQASLRRTFLVPETNLDQWWGVDIDNSGTQDIEVFFEPVPEEWQIGSIFDFAVQVFTENILELGITVEYSIHKLDSADANFTSPEFQYLEVYIAKSFSHNNQNFMFFLGFNFTNIVDYFNSSIEVTAVQLELFDVQDIIQAAIQAVTQGGIDLGLAERLNLSGPYKMNWDSGNEALNSLGLDVASARIEFTGSDDYEFLNRSWADVDFKPSPPYNTVPTEAELFLDADDSLSSFDEIRWTASHICDAHIEFFDSQQNVTFAEIDIDDLPKSLVLYMRVEEKNGQNITIIDYDASHAITSFSVLSYEFYNTSFEDITQHKIDSGQVEYVHLYLNVSHLPRKLYVEGVFYLEEIEEPSPITPGTGVIDQFVDMVVHRVTSRFTRIAKTLGSIPSKVLNMAEQGSFATLDTYYGQYSDDIDEIEFLFTSGDYVTTTGNYFAFYNNTHSSNYPTAQISLSGRISKIRYINASFETDASAKVEMMDSEPFRAIYTDDINDLHAEAILSNVPGTIEITKTEQSLRYNGGNDVIDEVRFISEYQNSYMDLKISDMAKNLYLEFGDNSTYLTTENPGDKIGEIDFLVTTGPIYRMNGNYLMLHNEWNFSVLSGRIKDVSTAEYVTGVGGKLEVSFAQENPITISLYDDRDEFIAADLIIDPMPTFISVDLSGLFSAGAGQVTPPRLESTGVLGLVSIIFGIAALGNEILTIADDTMQNAISNVGNVISDLSFSYETDTHITLIGKVQRGEEFTMDDVDWMHGISAVQKTKGDEISMAAKLYLTGLPTDGSISTKVEGDDVFLDFHLEDYEPLYDWLCLDVRGLQNRNTLLYIDDIPQGVDLNLLVNLNTQLNVIPQRAMGEIKMTSDENLGSLYGRMVQTESEVSISEVYLSSVPKELETGFSLHGNISINYTASSGIENMFIKSTRTRDGEAHDIYAILHEIPEQMDISVVPTTEYDMDGSLLQTLPNIEMTSSGSSLDAFIFADGKGIGQVGIFEFQVVNAPLSLECAFEDDMYRVKSSGVDYLWVHAMDLPVMEGYTTESLELVGKDIKSFDITVDTLFGNYPIISIEDSSGGEAQLVIDQQADGSRAGIALIDFSSKDGVPQSPRILINGGSVDLDKGSSHTLIPLPILTLWLTIFG